MEHELSGGRARVDVLSQRGKPDASSLELLRQSNQIGQAATEAVSTSPKSDKNPDNLESDTRQPLSRPFYLS